MPVEGSLATPRLVSRRGHVGSSGVRMSVRWLQLSSPPRDPCPWHREACGGLLAHWSPPAHLSWKVTQRNVTNATRLAVAEACASGVQKSIYACAWQCPSSAEGMEQFGFLPQAVMQTAVSYFTPRLPTVSMASLLVGWGLNAPVT